MFQNNFTLNFIKNLKKHMISYFLDNKLYYLVLSYYYCKHELSEKNIDVFINSFMASSGIILSSSISYELFNTFFINTFISKKITQTTQSSQSTQSTQTYSQKYNLFIEKNNSSKISNVIQNGSYIINVGINNIKYRFLLIVNNTSKLFYDINNIEENNIPSNSICFNDLTISLSSDNIIIIESIKDIDIDFTLIDI